MGDEPTTDKKAKDERLRAVIADDDPFARRVMKDALAESGVLVIAEARNGRQAVELACHHRPDVVIMDVVMPELDGIGATREILKEVPQQLVIVLTGAEARRSSACWPCASERPAFLPRTPTSMRCRGRWVQCKRGRSPSRGS